MKCLIISPYPLIHTWRLQELMLATTLKKQGVSVEIATCNGFQKHCASKLARKVTWKDEVAKKEAVCTECKANNSLFEKISDFTHVSMDDFIEPEDESRIKTFIGKSDIYSPELTFNNIKIKAIASYNVLISFQTSSVNKESDNDLKNAYKLELFNLIQGLLLAHRLIKNRRPDRIIYCNGFYPIERSFHEVAKTFEIPTYYFHASNNHQRILSRFQIGKTDSRTFRNSLIEKWKKYKDLPLRNFEIEDCYEHLFKYVFTDFYACYSEKVGNDKAKSIMPQNKKKKIVVLTMSSHDELVSAQQLGYKVDRNRRNLFSDQVKWVEKSLDWVSGRDDVFLIVRPHPREFSNKRNNFGPDSKSALELRKLFKNHDQANLFFCWPEHKISLYELFEHCHLVINGWSSAGIEAGLLGLPVVNCFPAYTNEPPDLDQCIESGMSYHNKLDSCLELSWSAERMAKFARWRHLYANRAELQFLDKPIKDTAPPANKSTNGNGDNDVLLKQWQLKIKSLLKESRVDKRLLAMLEAKSDSILGFESKESSSNLSPTRSEEIQALKNICNEYVSLRSNQASILKTNMRNFCKINP